MFGEYRVWLCYNSNVGGPQAVDWVIGGSQIEINHHHDHGQRGGGAISGVHIFTSFYTILDHYIQLFMFSVIVTSFVNFNINLIPVFVWKIKSFCKFVPKVIAMFDW